MYVLSDTVGGNRDAYDALEGAFGPREFTPSEAAAVLQNALYISELDASRAVRELIRMDVIKEVE